MQDCLLTVVTGHIVLDPLPPPAPLVSGSAQINMQSVLWYLTNIMLKLGERKKEMVSTVKSLD